MKIPGPDHPITIAPHEGRVRVRFAGRTVAETSRALALREASYPPVFYIPREEADADLLRKTPTVTHCPYKGAASYYSIEVDGRTAKDAIWSYESPHPAVVAIAGHLAFYPDRVDAIEAA